MLRNILLTTLFTTSLAFAQEAPFCTTHSLSNKQIEANPELKRSLEILEEKTLEYQEMMSQAKAAVDADTKVIPVVIHIIHDYENGNIDDSQVFNAIEILNEDYNKENDDIDDVVAAFSGITGDVNVEFRLAQLDPDGNCTNGITRTYSPMTNYAGENVKTLVKWDVDKYVNVWVVDNIASGAGGYTYIPGSAPPYDDPDNADGDAGILVRHQQFGGIGTSSGSASARHTLSHEFGHFFNLRHTWGPTNSPGVAGNCNWDDGVTDTPPCEGITNCDLTNVSCGSLDNIQNFMSYTGCPRMFTEGQKDRMQFVLDNGNYGVASRDLLWQPSNLIATGTNDNYVADECSPISDFYAEQLRVCADDLVKLEGLGYNASTIDYEWTLPGATPSTSTDQEAEVVYSTPGIYDVTLKVSNAQGQDIKTVNSKIIVREAQGFGGAVPYIEQGFEPNFTLNSPTDPETWDTEHTSNGTGWEHTNTAAIEGDWALRVRSRDFDEDLEGEEARVYMPIYDFSDITPSSQLHFKSAYSLRNSSIEDVLRIQVSKNCGSSWLPRASFDQDELATVPGNNPANWIPTDNDWQQLSVGLNSSFVQGEDELMIRFVLEGQGGNYLYIDDIELHDAGIGLEEIEMNTSFDIAPNPATEETNLYIENVQAMNYSIQLVDALGKEIARYEGGATMEATIPLSNIKADLVKGLYYVRLTNELGNITKKLVVM